MDKGSVLVAHSDKTASATVRAALEEASFRTLVVTAAPQVVRRVERKGVTLVVVDARLALAGSGHLLAWLRDNHLPVVCVAPPESPEAADVLDLGADDVLMEPFSSRELVARIKAVLRGYARSRVQREVVTLDAIAVHRGGRFATLNGRRLGLTRSELELLTQLVTSPGRVFKREELLASILAKGKNATPRLIDTHITSLRRKLGRAGTLIETVRGYGYRARESDD